MGVRETVTRWGQTHVAHTVHSRDNIKEERMVLLIHTHTLTYTHMYIHLFISVIAAYKYIVE